MCKTDQSVLIYFYYGKDDLDELHELDLRLFSLLENKDVGYYDGHEINMDGTDGTLFFYGPNAEKLFNTIESTLATADFINRATVYLRFGSIEENAKEIEFEIEKIQ